MSLGSISDVNAPSLEPSFPRRGRGRPTARHGTKKDERLSIFVTEARKEEIEALAEQLGLSISALLDKALGFFLKEKGLCPPKKTGPS